MQSYLVKKLNKKQIVVNVPGSKSITNRALLLAALSDGECVLNGVLFSDDTRVFLQCLQTLGFDIFIQEEIQQVKIFGLNGQLPLRSAVLNVGSAGTAARFITVFLAMSGGEFLLDSSDQMRKRPMQPLLNQLISLGVKIKFLEEEGHFPFKLISEGIKDGEIEIDTKTSSQFASALLLCGSVGGLQIKLLGNRTAGAYILMTEKMLSQFNISFKKEENTYFIPETRYILQKYDIEPDVSAACYFYSAGALLGIEAQVNGIHFNSLQGDIKFISVLQKMGCTVFEEKQGIKIKGPQSLKGISIDMNDFSDQALTLCAIAPFANSPTKIQNIQHIRMQECDRIHAMSVNLTAMGVKYEEQQDSITIYPSMVKPACIKTFNDHRVAMSFAVVGLKTGEITIDNPTCCKKTFENFFTVLENL